MRSTSWRWIRSLSLLKAHVEMLERERIEFGPDYHDHGVLFCWQDDRPPQYVQTNLDADRRGRDHARGADHRRLAYLY